VPPVTPDAVMAQMGTGKKKEEEIVSILAYIPS
jgi:hypothetical protein